MKQSKRAAKAEARAKKRLAEWNVSYKQWEEEMMKAASLREQEGTGDYVEGIGSA